VHRRAVASEYGTVVHADAERMAGPDELVALAVPALVRLAVAGLLVDGDPECSQVCAGALAESAAEVLWVLDRALAARPPHRLSGRGLVGPCHPHAHIEAAAVSTFEMEDMPLGTVIEAPPTRWRM
jgi:hypothetical protein